jgi:AcrR family transcriptional regulator
VSHSGDEPSISTVPDSGRTVPVAKDADDEVSVPTENEARILEVAVREFAMKGFAGTRVAEIAKHADVNKQLLYYYFGSKAGLFSAALGQMVGVARTRLLAFSGGTGTYAERLVATINPDSISRRHTLRRLWIWEALERGDVEIVREEERRETWERAVDLVRHAQIDGASTTSSTPRWSCWRSTRFSARRS